MTPVLASPTTRHTNSSGTAPRKIHQILKFKLQSRTVFFRVTDRAAQELGTALFDYLDPNADEPDPEDEHAEGRHQLDMENTIFAHQKGFILPCPCNITKKRNRSNGFTLACGSISTTSSKQTSFLTSTLHTRFN
jgi:hypothetical protein